MKVRMTLSASEAWALRDVARALVVALGKPKDFGEMQEVDALVALWNDLGEKLMDLREKVRVTLSDAVSAVLWERIDASELPPYEQALMAKVHGEMDRHYHRRMTAMTALDGRALEEGGRR